MEENQKMALYNLVVRTKKLTTHIEYLKNQRELLLEQIIKLQSAANTASNQLELQN